MKFNVTVDLEDLYDEYNGEEGSGVSFNEQILDNIKYELKREIWNEFRKNTLDEFKTKINSELSKGKDTEIDRIIQKVFSEKKIKTKDSSRNSPEEMITLFEYIEERITKDYFSIGSNAEDILRSKMRDLEFSIEKSITNASDKISNELKDRYDMLFASQLVVKMNQNGLLKENVADILLPKKE